MISAGISREQLQLIVAAFNKPNLTAAMVMSGYWGRPPASDKSDTSSKRITNTERGKKT